MIVNLGFTQPYGFVTIFYLLFILTNKRVIS